VLRTFLAFLVITPTFALAAEGPVAQGVRPLVIAHRGASAYLPEHTLEAYARAIDQGADYIETDLVVTRDGYLVARHENELSDSTDIAQRFPDRKTKKMIEGREVEGWFSEDFTLEELSGVGAKERLPFRSQENNHLYHIPTIAEILTLRSSKSRETGRAIGIYIETKHPAHFRSIARPMEPALMSILRAWAMDRPGAPIFLESFDPDSVKRMATETQGPVIQLLALPEHASDANLKMIATYAKGIGPEKAMIVPVSKEGRTGAPTDLVTRAHKLGLVVHPYTFRPEKQFQAASYGNDPAKEYCLFQSLGVDGVFTDAPDLALKAFRESCPITAPSPAK
jgi:glycerophosphoryl diester phosphodiesterase